MITMNNAEIMARIDAIVYGHPESKKKLINLMRRVDYMWKTKFIENREPKCDPLKTLIIGQSGTGKTLMTKAICEICDINFFEVDCTSISPAGAADGKTPSQLATELRKSIAQAWNTSVSKGYTICFSGIKARTVIYLDEIDKLATSWGTNGNWNRQTQSGLLKLLEGSEELEGVNFIMSGAFSGITDTKVQNSLGFTSNDTASTAEKEITADDVVKYGIIPELVGRMNCITVLDSLGLDDYIRVLDAFVLPDKNAYLRDIGAELLELTHAEKESMCEIAMESGQGIRSLSRQAEELACESEFQCFYHEGGLL